MVCLLYLVASVSFLYLRARKKCKISFSLDNSQIYYHFSSGWNRLTIENFPKCFKWYCFVNTFFLKNSKGWKIIGFLVYLLAREFSNNKINISNTKEKSTLSLLERFFLIFRTICFNLVKSIYFMFQTSKLSVHDSWYLTNNGNRVLDDDYSYLCTCKNIRNMIGMDISIIFNRLPLTHATFTDFGCESIIIRMCYD